MEELSNLEKIAHFFHSLPDPALAPKRGMVNSSNKIAFLGRFTLGVTMGGEWFLGVAEIVLFGRFFSYHFVAYLHTKGDTNTMKGRAK